MLKISQEIIESSPEPSDQDATAGSIPRPQIIAAVDLGSNSFHMIVGELRHGQLVIIDRLKETVRLSEGLRDGGRLMDAAQRRAIQCLSRFGERLRAMHASAVRTAGTSALRRASNSSDFLEEAEAALGHPIEIVSGIEEARLIFAGVTHSMPSNDGSRLVLDIGGGSTELILGDGNCPRELNSLHMGCVLMTEKYFSDGKITRKRMAQARTAAQLKLRPVKAYFRDKENIEAIGTSGTIIATENAARSIGLIESNDLSADVVEALIEKVLEYKTIKEISLPGLSVRRSQVFPGGLAILIELLNGLRIDSLKVSDGAMREGLIYDQLGRLQDEDARERTVRAMMTRYNVSKPQAKRVANTAVNLVDQVRADWKLKGDLFRSLASWAGRLHEMGLDISHYGFHRHGAYIVANADMPGFPRSEQRFLSFLIANQRAEIDLKKLKHLPSSLRKKALRLSILIRLAVLLHRSRSDNDLSHLKVRARNGTLSLKFADGWLENNPLTVADLKRENNLLAAAGYSLEYE